ncbi:hypothetical protein RF55_24406 [Lasius niger]|uniref:Uncharacterized protein n=1 Tax=Lasius niger TaxID=67767 RepID=A0A0J7MN51_LASNI|nr:hypothetical protein RF55_24406 [Lasius niger]
MWINLKYRCRKSDSARKQYQLQTGGGLPVEMNEDEDINEIVRSIVPTIDLTLENPWEFPINCGSTNDGNSII